jgi:hypothetical protein
MKDRQFDLEDRLISFAEELISIFVASIKTSNKKAKRE